MQEISENRARWKHFKEHSEINQQHIWKTHQVATENSHIGHCKHTAESANKKVQNIFHGRNNITCTSSTNCKHRTAAKIYTLETWLVSGL